MVSDAPIHNTCTAFMSFKLLNMRGTAFAPITKKHKVDKFRAPVSPIRSLDDSVLDF